MSDKSWKCVANFSEHGRSRLLIMCPFCGAKSWAYEWSLAGCGKRCENKACRAMFARNGSAYEYKKKVKK